MRAPTGREAPPRRSLSFSFARKQPQRYDVPFTGKYTKKTAARKFPHSTGLGSCLGDGLIGWYDPIGDGNCGYRVLSQSVLGTQKHWKTMREELLLEIMKPCYGSYFGDHQAQYKRINFMDEKAEFAPEANWMCGDDCAGFATIHNWAIVVIAPRKNTVTGKWQVEGMTYLPMRAEEGVTEVVGELWILRTTGAHFVRLIVDPTKVGIPGIAPPWRYNREDSVVGWEHPYATRIAQWYASVRDPDNTDAPGSPVCMDLTGDSPPRRVWESCASSSPSSSYSPASSISSSSSSPSSSSSSSSSDGSYSALNIAKYSGLRTLV